MVDNLKMKLKQPAPIGADAARFDRPPLPPSGSSVPVEPLLSLCEVEELDKLIIANRPSYDPGARDGAAGVFLCGGGECAHQAASPCAAACSAADR
jgi:hypothetical protein